MIDCMPKLHKINTSNNTLMPPLCCQGLPQCSKKTHCIQTAVQYCRMMSMLQHIASNTLHPCHHTQSPGFVVVQRLAGEACPSRACCGSFVP